MKIEIHILQSFPPANLNRDENGMPKSTVFGGRPRARISSQCQKRAVRKYYHEHHKELGIASNLFADRSRKWMPELKKLLIDGNIAKAQAEIAAKLALAVLGAKIEGDGVVKSKTILFLGRTEIAAIADILIKNWSVIEPSLQVKEPSLPTKEPNIPKLIEKALTDTGKPGDVALFGRMMAALPTVNVDASVQMAHAISVNTLQQEFDFFTAVDDLGDREEDEQEAENKGADHLGETGYNSSTYYRYTNVDLEQLTKNLGSTESVQSVVKAFAQAFVQAIPTGHQNSFAAHTPPALVMMVVRKGQPISLVDAFEEPVRPSGTKSLLDNAVIAIDTHWQDLNKMYGNKTEYVGVVTRSKLASHLKNLKSDEKDSVEALLTATLAKAFPGA
jgi:CRISPR system Cascade subunit CasC